MIARGPDPALGEMRQAQKKFAAAFYGIWGIVERLNGIDPLQWKFLLFAGSK
jgi:hypothetical protein